MHHLLGAEAELLGGSAALRWIPKVRSPAEAAPEASQEFDETKPSSALLTSRRRMPALRAAASSVFGSPLERPTTRDLVRHWNEAAAATRKAINDALLRWKVVLPEAEI